MADLSTQYMGLDLKSPIIVSSCGLTNSVESIRSLEANGVGAVVLKSLYEEQILMETESLASDYTPHAEELDYIKGYTRQNQIDEYLTLISSVKKQSSIPIIASVNCVSASEWTHFAKKIQDAGADALELNIFILPGNINQTAESIEMTYFDIVREVRKQITIPISVKLGFYFTAPANMIYKLSTRDINAIVMFNRFFRPDIDLEKMELTSAGVYSVPEENAVPLRWIGLLAEKVDCDLASTTGIHDGLTAIKNLLAGAKVAYVVSAIYNHGASYIQEMNEQINSWLDSKSIKSVSSIIGRLSANKAQDPVIYERTQFMKYFSNAK